MKTRSISSESNSHGWLIRRVALACLLTSSVFLIRNIPTEFPTRKRKLTEQEKAIRLKTFEAKAKINAIERRDRFMPERAKQLLNSPTFVESLNVGRGNSRPRSATGNEIEASVASDLRAILLIYRNYMYLNADDMPIPETGIRFRNGDETLDILVELQGDPERSPHVDVFAYLTDSEGKEKYLGQKCISNGRLYAIFDPLVP